MKFKSDRFGDRTLETKDCDGDLLRVTGYGRDSCTISVNSQAVRLTHKQIRKLAKAILKETAK